jgi:hypothetical protein
MGGAHDGESGHCCGACEFASELERTGRAIARSHEVVRADDALAIVVTRQGAADEHVPFGDKHEMRVGRVAGNDVVLANGNISKRQCVFTRANDVVTVRDLGSSCGTYVNGKNGHGPITLHEGDRVYVGDYVLRVVTDQRVGRQLAAAAGHTSDSTSDSTSDHTSDNTR